MLVAELTLS